MIYPEELQEQKEERYLAIMEMCAPYVGDIVSITDMGPILKGIGDRTAPIDVSLIIPGTMDYYLSIHEHSPYDRRLDGTMQRNNQARLAMEQCTELVKGNFGDRYRVQTIDLLRASELIASSNPLMVSPLYYSFEGKTPRQRRGDYSDAVRLGNMLLDKAIDVFDWRKAYAYAVSYAVRHFQSYRDNTPGGRYNNAHSPVVAIRSLTTMGWALVYAIHLWNIYHPTMEQGGLETGEKRLFSEAMIMDFQTLYDKTEGHILRNVSPVMHDGRFMQLLKDYRAAQHSPFDLVERTWGLAQEMYLLSSQLRFYVKNGLPKLSEAERAPMQRLLKDSILHSTLGTDRKL